MPRKKKTTKSHAYFGKTEADIKKGTKTGLWRETLEENQPAEPYHKQLNEFYFSKPLTAQERTELEISANLPQTAKFKKYMKKIVYKGAEIDEIRETGKLTEPVIVTTRAGNDVAPIIEERTDIQATNKIRNQAALLELKRAKNRGIDYDDVLRQDILDNIPYIFTKFKREFTDNAIEICNTIIELYIQLKKAIERGKPNDNPPIPPYKRVGNKIIAGRTLRIKNLVYNEIYHVLFQQITPVRYFRCVREFYSDFKWHPKNYAHLVHDFNVDIRMPPIKHDRFLERPFFSNPNMKYQKSGQYAYPVIAAEQSTIKRRKNRAPKRK